MPGALDTELMLRVVTDATSVAPAMNNAAAQVESSTRRMENSTRSLIPAIDQVNVKLEGMGEAAMEGAAEAGAAIGETEAATATLGETLTTLGVIGAATTLALTAGAGLAFVALTRIGDSVAHVIDWFNNWDAEAKSTFDHIAEQGVHMQQVIDAQSDAYDKAKIAGVAGSASIVANQKLVKQQIADANVELQHFEKQLVGLQAYKDFLKAPVVLPAGPMIPSVIIPNMHSGEEMDKTNTLIKTMTERVDQLNAKIMQLNSQTLTLPVQAGIAKFKEGIEQQIETLKLRDEAAKQDYEAQRITSTQLNNVLAADEGTRASLQDKLLKSEGASHLQMENAQREHINRMIKIMDDYVTQVKKADDELLKEEEKFKSINAAMMQADANRDTKEQAQTIKEISKGNTDWVKSVEELQQAEGRRRAANEGDLAFLADLARAEDQIIAKMRELQAVMAQPGKGNNKELQTELNGLSAQLTRIQTQADQVSKKMASGFTSAIQTMLNDSQGLRHGFETALLQMEQKFVLTIVRMLAQWVAHLLARRLAHLTEVAVETTTEAAGANAKEAATLPHDISVIARAAARGAAKVYADVLEVVPPPANFILAPIAAAGTFAAIGAYKTLLSASGGFDVPELSGGSVVTQLHSREMVLPRQHAEAVRNMTSGGGDGGGGAPTTVQISHNITAVDHRGVAALLVKERPTLHQIIASAVRTGHLNLAAGQLGGHG